MIKRFYESGLWFPIGIAVGLGVMVLWNVFFIYMAISTAPDVRTDYTHAIER
ncbi:MAG: hypothetical protein KC656_25980 [Myxococcales bacterium]|nr:hypothetical protein [Myxococcales bacterium]MCB9671811.1 hypothetical protein [Alphaproteobacteria bacterium]